MEKTLVTGLGGVITSFLTNTVIEQLNNTITLAVQLTIGIITVYQLVKKRNEKDSK